MNSFIAELMSRMNLQEKLGQLDLQSGFLGSTGSYINEDYEEQIRKGQVGAIFNAFGPELTRRLQQIAVEETRLGIPLIVAHDVIHGHKTIFPQPLGETASWDVDLARETARAAAREATADGIAWTFAPMADISRDPRWGRVAEGSGEDVYLTSCMAVAKVQGFQGSDLSRPDTMMACGKHFASYGLSQGGLDYQYTDVSERELWTTQLPPFKAMVDAGVTTIMAGFNDLNGTPASASKKLLTDILRNQWGFEGFVVADYTSVNQLIPHGLARNEKHAAELAFNAGLDMDMVGRSYRNHLAELLDEGKVSQAQIDNSVRLILEMKWRLGLFDDPYRYCDPERASKEHFSKQNLELARDAARRSMVLLKNSEQTLPLDASKLKSIALIGPLADSDRDMLGNWVSAGELGSNPVSLRAGLSAHLGDSVSIHYAKGATYAYLHEPDDDEPYLKVESVARSASDDPVLERDFQEAIEVARASDLIVLAMGEEYRMSGEASSRTELGLPGNQLALMKALKKLGKPMVLVLFSGRPNDLRWENANLDAILHAWYPGTSGGHAVADVLFGDYSPSGKLPITFPRSVGQVPIHYNRKNTGHPYDPTHPDQNTQHFKSCYEDAPSTPLFPFGYGLSYTQFEYSAIELSSDTLRMNGDSLTVSVDVTNIGRCSGEEVVQLYIRQLVSSTVRPLKELKGFQKLHFAKGQTRRVEFVLTSADLAFYRAGMNWGSELGKFHVMIGPSSEQLEVAEFKLIE